MTANLEKVLSNYLQLCRNPLRGTAALTADFYALLGLPQVTSVQVLRNNELLAVDTTDIHVQHEETGVWHNLGQYTIFIARKCLGVPPTWKVRFFFLKPEDDTAFLEKNPDWANVIHPHITLASSEEYRVQIGRLCIDRGGFPIDQSIRNGDLLTAVSLLLNILGTYHSDAPFINLSNWPLLNSEGEL